jgi:type I restriction enzyme R subunit
VHKFKDRKEWDALSDDDRKALQEEVAGLPSEMKTDEIESRLFDLLALRMQLATIEHRAGDFEKDRKKAVEIAMMLEDKSAVPAVNEQLGYLQQMQETDFWVGIDITALEDMRLRLRDLVPLLDKTKRHIVYTDFEDEITSVKDGDLVAIPRMTGVQYQKKVEQYLQSHLNNIVIHRLRTNQALTKSDLLELEKMLIRIGEVDGEALLKGLLAQTKAPTLAHFVRGLVGMDRASAQTAFSKLMSNQSLTPPQIRFVEMIIEQLTARGVIEPGALYEAPFTGLHAGGPDALFAGKSDIIAGIFQAIEATQPTFQSRAV